ncbi:uncharacterized protein LOC141696843 isoform X2 [Apium graveolens]|uniref:uncharacterized protein LOC141696843 isoform X2 n=1 Tax=Apium graveolens TaxID=4045 RepID=UPI003D7AA73A
MDHLDVLYDAAIARGDAEAITELVMEADKLNRYGRSILHTESKNGNTERVRFILKEFANKNLLEKLTYCKETALHWAIYGGHTKVAEVLIEAARRHLPEISFQSFLRQGDQDNDTALHCAVMYGHVAIVKLLVEADPTDTHKQNYSGKTPMYIAVEKGLNDIVEIILTTCTTPSLDGPNGSTVLRINNFDQVKSHGGTIYKVMDRNALYDAAIAGNADAIAKLEMEADMLNCHHETILQVESKYGNTKHVRFILRELANKNLLEKFTQNGFTALQLAIDGQHTEVAEVIIDAARRHLSGTSCQAFLRHGDKDMDTALHAAVRGGYVAIVKLLVEADPTDTHSQNKLGETPIYIAVEKGYPDVVKVICTTCTSPLNFDGPGGITALHAAVRNGNNGIEVVEVLIDAARLLLSSDANPVSSFQAFLRRVDGVWNTALHGAVIKGQMDVVKLLVEADPTHRHYQNLDGKTPIYIAAEKGYTNIVKVICTTCTAPLNFEGPDGITALHAAVKYRNKDITYDINYNFKLISGSQDVLHNNQCRF